MLDAGIIKAAGYAEGGWVTGLKYEDEILEDLKARTSGKPDKLRAVNPTFSMHCPGIEKGAL